MITQNGQLNWNGLLDVTTGLVGHWTLDIDGSDASGNGLDGTLSGNAFIDTSAGNQNIGAGNLALDGDDDYLDLSTHAASFNNLTEGTIAGWIKTTETTDFETLFSGADQTDDSSFISLGLYQGNLFFDVAEQGSDNVYLLDLDSTVFVADGNWHHIAVTVDASGNNLYFDGTKVALADLTYNTGDASSTFFFDDVLDIDEVQIGVTAEKGNYVYDTNGSIDDVRIYSRALTASDINDLFIGNKAPSDITLSQATSVTINNPGFEVQSIGDGGTASSVTDWTDSGDSGVWNPDQAGYSNEAPEGENIAYVSATAGGQTLSQALSDTFQAGRSYNLSSMIGDEIGATETTTWEMRLYAGSQLLGSVGNADFDPSEDSFVRATLHLDADSLSTYSSVYGENLKIEFYNDDAGGGQDLHVDDVQLEYTEISINENTANGTVVADVVSVTDPDAGDTHTFTLTDNAGGRFAIDSNSGEITVADGSLLDYETVTSHNITVRATDAEGLTYDEVVTIQVANVNEAPTFFQESDGIVTTDVGADHDYGQSLITQPDGKILVSGMSDNGTDGDIVLLRYNADGSLDTSFSTDGMLTTDIGTNEDFGRSVTLQSDGKILVAGYSYNGADYDFALVRYNADGSLDTSFSTDGMLTTDIGTHDDFGRSVTLQSDGKILVAGYSYNGADYDFALVRYNADGSLDTSFSTDGMLTTDIGTHSDYGMDVTLQSDGKILVAGMGSNGTDGDFALVRYNTDGSLDTNFGTNGILTTAIGASTDNAYGVVVQSDGKILLAGSSDNGANYDFAIVRYNNDGSLDTSFGTNGMVTTDIDANYDGGRSITLQPDGTILLAGSHYNGSNNDFALVRYNSDGTLDTNFSDDGKLTTPIGSGSDYGKGVVVQDDGKILVVGNSDNGSNHDIALVRYNSDGTLDSSFDTVYTLDGTPTFTEDGSPVVLDADVQIFDAELGAANNFSGATLTLSRNGGVDAEDLFSATGNLAALTEGASLVLSGTTIGTVTTNSAGTLNLTFDANATQALVNETMQSIAYANSSDTPPASAQINWVFDDGNTGSQGTGGALQATGSTSVTIIAVNDAPVITSADAVNVAENQTDVTTVTATDAENDTLTFSITGGPDADKFVINNSTGELVFANAPDYENPSDSDHNNVYNVTVQANDGQGGVDTQDITINVTNANDNSPLIHDLMTSIAEDAVNGTGVADLNDANTGNDTDLDGDALTYSISSGNDEGIFTIDSSTGVITILDNTHLDYETGQQYVLTILVSDGVNSDTAAVTINVTDVDEFDVGAVTDTDGIDDTVAEDVGVGTTVGITAQATDPDGTDTVTYSLSDDAGGLFAIDNNSGIITVANVLDYETATSHSLTVVASSSDGSTSNASFTINVTDVDEYDVGAITDTDGADNTVGEDAGVGSAVGITAQATDSDGTDTVTYALSDDAGGLFAIDNNSGLITVVNVLDYETATSHSVIVVASSSDGSTSNASFTINVTDVDEYDVGAVTDTDGANNTVAEDAGVGTTVGITAQATDPDGTDTVTYSLSDDAGGLFTIDATSGVITVANTLDYETSTSHSVTVQATSTDGSTSSQAFTINVTDVDEYDVGPVSNSDTNANSVAEDAGISTTIGITALATDADGTDTVTYSLSDDAGGLFTIDATSGVVTVANTLDYETATSHSVTVQATSTDGSTSSQAFTINVTDVDEYDVGSVSDSDTNANSAAEDAGIGTTIGITALATDADGSDTVSYSLSDDAGGLFTIDATSGVVTVANTLDYETATSHSVTVQATSTDGSTSFQAFTINVTDVDEYDVGPVSDSDTNANSVAEDAGISTTIGITALATDADGSDTVSYSLSDDAGGLFTIDATSGVVTVANTLDYETSTSHSVTVQATSTDGSTSSQAFVIDVTDINESAVGPVTDSDNADNTVGEDAANGTAVGITALATDADGSDTVSYSLSDDAGGLFTIDATSGVVTVANTLDYETSTSHSVTVQATSTDGSTSSQAFTINVTDVDEYDVGPVTDSDNADNTVGEDAANGTAVGITALATDADGSDTVSYSLSDDAGGLFTIDATSGVITVANALDYETAASHSVTVRSESTDGSFSVADFLIQINDVNEANSENNNDDGTESTNDNETDSNVDNNNENTDNTNISDDGETIISVFPTDEEAQDEVYDDDKDSGDIDNISLTDFENDQPGDTDVSDDETQQDEEEALLVVDPEDTAQAADILVAIEDQTIGYRSAFEELSFQASESSNTARQIQKETYAGMLRKAVKIVTTETLDFITPSVSAISPGLMEVNETMRTQLSYMNQEMDQAFEDSREEHIIKVYFASGVSASFAVGTAGYLLRGGSLMSSFLTTVPLWKAFDPVAILMIPKKKNKKDKERLEKNESPSFTSTDCKAENMFAGNEKTE